MQFYENLLGRRAAGRSVILSAGHQALATRSSIQLRLVPSPRGEFVGVGVRGSMPVQQVSGVPWGWHHGAKMRFELEWGGSWDRASAERSAIAACRRRTRRGRDGRGRSRLRCHRHLFADFLFVQMPNPDARPRSDACHADPAATPRRRTPPSDPAIGSRGRSLLSVIRSGYIYEICVCIECVTLHVVHASPAYRGMCVLLEVIF